MKVKETLRAMVRSSDMNDSLGSYYLCTDLEIFIQVIKSMMYYSFHHLSADNYCHIPGGPLVLAEF